MNNMTVTQLCHKFLDMHVCPGDLCIDATAGNGHDTAYLARLTGDSGTVLAFDIQKTALENTRKRLCDADLLSRVQLIHETHEHLAFYADPGTVSCIVFNLGYLPGGDHALATNPDTTLPAIQNGLSLLKKNGLMALCIYQGGDTGFEEHDRVIAFLRALDPRQYLVILSSYLNRPNTPPDLALVIRLS